MNTEIYIIERYSEALGDWYTDGYGYYNYEAVIAQIKKEIKEDEELSEETKEEAYEEIDDFGYSAKAGICLRIIYMVDSEVM